MISLLQIKNKNYTGGSRKAKRVGVTNTKNNMSGFTDMMMDDGYSDPMEYMEMLESEYERSMDSEDGVDFDMCDFEEMEE